MNQNFAILLLACLTVGLIVPCLQHDVYKLGHLRVPMVNDKFVYDKSKVNKTAKSIA